MTNQQHEALRLADWLDDQYDPDHYKADAAAELRRLHAENAALQQGYDAARLGRESTQEKPMCKCKWQSIETAPKDSGYLLLRGGREQDVASGYWLQTAYAGNGAWIWPFVHMTPRFWAPLPPTSAEAVEHG